MPSELDQVVSRCETILAQCLIAANQAAEAAASIGIAGLAPLQSPAFTGAPTAPTPTAGDASTRLATTAFIGALLGQPNGVATLDLSGIIPVSQLPFAGLTYDGTWDANLNTPTLQSSSGTVGHFFVVTVSGTTNLSGITNWNSGDWALRGTGVWTRIPYVAPPISNLPLSSLEAIGSNTMVANTLGGSAAPSAISIASITSLLTTAVGDSGGGGIKGLVPAAPPGSAGSGAFLRADMIYAVPPGPNLSAYALLDSPAFIGTPTGPTIARGTNSTALATAAFVIAQLASASEIAPVVNGTASAGTSTYGARIDHIHPTDTSRAAALSPQFTGSGVWNGTLTLTGTFTLNGTMNGVVVKEANLSFVDGTVGNASTTKHGLLPKLSGNASQVLSGTGGFVTPVAGGLVSLTVLLASTTVTIPAGATSAVVRFSGGAGGAGNTNTGGGGGAAAIFKYLSGLTPGNTLSWTRGAGGSTSNGTSSVLASGTQSISTLTAGGGSTSSTSDGGAGGTATGGDLNIPGQRGTLASPNSGEHSSGGMSGLGLGHGGNGVNSGPGTSGDDGMGWIEWYP